MLSVEIDRPFLKSFKACMPQLCWNIEWNIEYNIEWNIEWNFERIIGHLFLRGVLKKLIVSIGVCYRKGVVEQGTRYFILLRSELVMAWISMVRQVGEISPTVSWSLPGKFYHTLCRSLIKACTAWAGRDQIVERIPRKACRSNIMS